ncbi:MAG: phage holin family protein [Chitinophagaceae bacterium]|nr:phage holin family protein [Chitinophagaceae bacterium]
MSDHLTQLVQDTGKYIEAKTELWKLKVADKTTEVASSVASQLMIAVIALLVIISVNTGVALILGKWLGELYYGFFIVAGFYILLGVIMYANRTILMKTPFYNAIINKILK